MRLTLFLGGVLVCACLACHDSQTPYQLAKERVAANDLPGATGVLREALASGTIDLDGELLLAELRRRDGDASGAIMSLRGTVERHPNDPRSLVMLGRVYGESGQRAMALESLQKARAKGAPDNLVALDLGTALAQSERLDEARAEFERARKAGLEGHVVDYNLGLLDVQRAAFADAVRHFEASHAAKSDWAPARRELARALLTQSPADKQVAERALDLLVDKLELFKEDWRAQEAIGDAWMVVGDIDAALQAYVEALRAGQNPKSVEDRYRVAKLRQRERDGTASSK
ncbi:MAG: Tetratricopeptide repeat [Planctomycetota bacterium]